MHVNVSPNVMLKTFAKSSFIAVIVWLHKAIFVAVFAFIHFQDLALA